MRKLIKYATRSCFRLQNTHIRIRVAPIPVFLGQLHSYRNTDISEAGSYTHQQGPLGNAGVLLTFHEKSKLASGDEITNYHIALVWINNKQKRFDIEVSEERNTSSEKVLNAINLHSGISHANRSDPSPSEVKENTFASMDLQSGNLFVKCTLDWVSVVPRWVNYTYTRISHLFCAMNQIYNVNLLKVENVGQTDFWKWVLW